MTMITTMMSRQYDICRCSK